MCGSSSSSGDDATNRKESPSETSLPYQARNGRVIDGWSRKGWTWGRSVDHETLERARRSDRALKLSPAKAAPRGNGSASARPEDTRHRRQVPPGRPLRGNERRGGPPRPQDPLLPRHPRRESGMILRLVSVSTISTRIPAPREAGTTIISPPTWRHARERFPVSLYQATERAETRGHAPFLRMTETKRRCVSCHNVPGAEKQDIETHAVKYLCGIRVRTIFTATRSPWPFSTDVDHGNKAQ